MKTRPASRGGSLVSPGSEGAVNYPSQSFSPQTGWHYTNVVNNYSPFYWSGETFLGHVQELSARDRSGDRQSDVAARVPRAERHQLAVCERR